jgi:hypothetical protein
MKRVFKKSILITIAMMVTCHLANAQEKKYEISVGASWGATETNSPADGLSFKFDVNLDYYINPTWSLMSGVGIWADGLVMDEEFDGADDDGGGFVSIPLIARYHLHVGDTHQQLVFGLGPALNFCVDRGEYHVNQDPSSPLNGRKKLNKLGFSLQPSAIYRFNKVGLGIEGNIGLINMQKHYGLTKGSLFYHNVWFKFCYHF